MKLTKSLFMLCAAGLSLCACNSDDIKDQMPEGPGMVEVNIINPFATTKAAATNGSTVNIQGTVTVTLTHANGTLTQTLTIDPDDAATKKAKFWNVVNPQKVTASINGGIANYTEIDITQESGTGGNLQAAPNVIPAYGETTTFGLSGDMQPTGEEDENSGYKEGDETKTFQKYTAGITMAIPVARLEVGHITHSAHTLDVCDFSELTIAGVYLDKVSLKGNSFASNKYAATTTVTDYTQSTAILKDGPASATAFNSSTYFPAENQVYAFNFFAGSQNPIFKVYFSSAIFATGAQKDQPREGWAMITRYKKWNTETSKYEDVIFENGKIYQIKNVTLVNITPNQRHNNVLIIIESRTSKLIGPAQIGLDRHVHSKAHNSAKK